MTGSIYDHMMAVILVGAVFVAAVGVLPNVGYVGFLSVDQQQLRNVAWSALNTMLLDAGFPLNWGSASSFNPSSVVRFGLASATSDLFVLDSDKVQKLVSDNPPEVGYMSYDTVRQLLGLEGYGFKMKIMAPFNATVKDKAPPANPNDPTDLELRTIDYEATVKYNDGKPIPNAYVSAWILASVKTGGGGQEEAYQVQSFKVTRTTNEVGVCRVQTTLSGQVSDVIIIFESKVGDIYTVSSTYRRGAPPDDIADVNVSGDWLILTTPPADPRDNRWLLSVHVYTGEGEIVSLYNGTQQDMFNWGSLQQWLKAFPGLKYMDPVLLLLNIRAVEKNAGRKGILVVGPFPRYMGGRVVSFGFSGDPPAGAAGAKINRVVNIDGMTYLVEFTLWKQQ